MSYKKNNLFRKGNGQQKVLSKYELPKRNPNFYSNLSLRKSLYYSRKIKLLMELLFLRAMAAHDLFLMKILNPISVCVCPTLLIIGQPVTQ